MFRLCRSPVAALCVASLICAVDTTCAAAFREVRAGDAAPSFTLPDLEGKPISLDELAEGPLTIVVFWTLWSPNSEPLLQDIQKILDEFGAREPRVRAVAVNEDGAQAPGDFPHQVRGLIARNGLKFPVVVDRRMDQYARWGVIASPSTAFLGKDLTVEYEFSGHPTSAYQDMREQARRILGIEEATATAAESKRPRYRAEHRVLLNFGLAKSLFARGQFAKADRKLQWVLHTDPNFPDAHALRGAIHLAMADGGETGAARRARQAFARAVELDGTVPLGLIGLAHFALEDGDTAKALELARHATQYTETETLAHLDATEPASTSPAATEVRIVGTPGHHVVPAHPGGLGSTADTGMAGLEAAAAALEAHDVDAAKARVRRFVAAFLANAEGPGRSELRHQREPTKPSN